MPARLRLIPAVIAVFALALNAAPALADGLQFSTPVQLPHGDPKGTPYFSGGEPSLAFDPAGKNHTYVTAPQSVPAAATSNGVGVAYWASDDGGATWTRSGLTGSPSGGGDSDVAVLSDQSVLVADLEATAANICISHDFATTFDCGNGINSNQQGPENDREWLTPGTKPGEVYLTYHDFAAGFPIIERSTDGGKSFAPCGTIIDPSDPNGGASSYTPQGGTLVSKPVIDAAGDIFVEFATPDQTASPVGAALNHLYMAVAKGGCTGQTVFKNYKVYSDPGADLAKIFLWEAIDGGGNLYVLTAGKTKAGQSTTNLWLFTSTDGGQHWSQPLAVNPPELKANVFPTITGGPAKGQFAFGWFGTSTSGDPNTQTNQWRFYAGESLDGGQSIAYTTVTPDVIHYGDICTQGVFCGLIPGQPGNRNLADFASMVVNPANGCPAAAIPGDPYNRPDQPNGDNNFSSSAYFARQTDPGSCFTAQNSGQAAGTIAPSASTPAGAPAITRCTDRIPPTTRITHAKVKGRRVSLSGTAADRGCGPKGIGKVSRVRVAIGRRYAHQKCRYLLPSGRYGKLVSCLRTSYLSAKGTTHWTFRLKRKLSKGRYVVWSRGIDSAGNIERKGRTINLKRFTVR